MTDPEGTPEARWQTLQEALTGAGVCNTRPTARFGRSASKSAQPPSPPGVYEAGIDTARFLFRLHDERQRARAREQLTYPQDLAGEMKVGYLDSHDMLWTQGRPSTVLWQEIAGERKLLPAAALPDAEQLVAMALDGHGYTDARPIGLSRVDSTVTIRFATPAEGWALLRGLAVLDVPLRKSRMTPAGGSRPPQTTEWLTERGRIGERAYDAGVKHNRAPAGTEIRLEGQALIKSRERTDTSWWTMERVHERFQRHFRPMAQAGGQLHVATEQAIRAQLRQWVTEGTIGATHARTLMGHLASESVGMPMAERTRRRNRAELRRLGLAHALDGIEEQPVDLDLGAVLHDALTSPHWND